jgi:hypothetical protein
MPTAEVRTHGHWLLPVVYTAAITTFSCVPPTPKPLSNGHDPTITVAVAAGPLLDSEIETILVEWRREHGYGAHVVIRRLSSEELLAFQYCSRCADTWVRIRLGAALRDLFLGDRVPSDACIDEVECANH